MKKNKLIKEFKNKVNDHIEEYGEKYDNLIEKINDITENFDNELQILEIKRMNDQINEMSVTVKLEALRLATSLNPTTIEGLIRNAKIIVDFIKKNDNEEQGEN